MSFCKVHNLLSDENVDLPEVLDKLFAEFPGFGREIATARKILASLEDKTVRLV